MSFNLEQFREMMTEDRRPSFDDLPPRFKVRAYGVTFAVLDDPAIGQIFITRYGWTFAEELLPARWFANHRYREEGYRLPGSTGTVYYVPEHEEAERPVELVVKFSRFAEVTPIQVSTIPDGAKWDPYPTDEFNSPFEEFGVLMDLRRGRYGPPGLAVRTKRPLAIYCPPERHPLWRLGRTESRFRPHWADLERNQEEDETGEGVHLDIEKQYIMLFQWIQGIDAETAWHEGLLTEDAMLALSDRVNEELRLKGFRVVDNKPKHFILRRNPERGALLKRDGQLVYGLVDFELLKRTSEYALALRNRRTAP